MGRESGGDARERTPTHHHWGGSRASAQLTAPFAFAVRWLGRPWHPPTHPAPTHPSSTQPRHPPSLCTQPQLSPYPEPLLLCSLRTEMSWEAASISPGLRGSGLVSVFSPAEAGGKFGPPGAPTGPQGLELGMAGFSRPPVILSGQHVVDYWGRPGSRAPRTCRMGPGLGPGSFPSLEWMNRELAVCGAAVGPKLA